MGHGITSARYSSPDTSKNASVTATVNSVQVSRRANDDVEGGGMLAYLAEGGKIDPFVPTPPTQDDYASAIQSLIDATAKAKGYADGSALAVYSESTIPAWALEAKTFIAWRDQVWVHAYTELAKVQAGQRDQPTIEAILAELPPAP